MQLIGKKNDENIVGELLGNITNTIDYYKAIYIVCAIIIIIGLAMINVFKNDKTIVLLFGGNIILAIFLIIIIRYFQI